MAERSTANAYLELARPFTLLAPALGMVSGSIMGWGGGTGAEDAFPWPQAAAGAAMAALLNAASNSLNQICDVDLDRVNKPRRPLPSGRLSLAAAGAFAALLYAVSLAVAWWINLQCFAIASAAVLFTLAYSVPPVRTKRFGLLANFTIAVPRGSLLVVAGWSTAADIFQPEPWYLSAVFGGFLLGAATTKDFADVEGDRLGGCKTLPVTYGARRAAWIISPFLVLPFLLLPLGVRVGLLSGHPVVLTALGYALAAWGLYVANTLISKPMEPASARNHASWKHMYFMMIAAQAGLAAAYAVGAGG